LPVNQLVVASGAWAAGCGIWLDIPLPVNPQRGQILTLKQPFTTSSATHNIWRSHLSRPKKDSTIVIGATKEEVGFDKHITAGASPGYSAPP